MPAPPHTHTHTLQDVLARFKAKNGTNSWDKLPEKACFQLNDTHPTIAMAELTRLLVDVEGLSWEQGVKLTNEVGGRRAGRGRFCWRCVCVWVAALGAWALSSPIAIGWGVAGGGGLFPPPLCRAAPPAPPALTPFPRCAPR